MWVYDLVGMLDKIYDTPAYIQDHPDPHLAFSRLEETVEVRKKKESLAHPSLFIFNIHNLAR